MPKTGVGVRTWLAALMVICSTLSPSLLEKYGPFVAVVLWLTGSPLRFRVTSTVWLSALFLGWMGLSTRWAINPLSHQDVLLWVSLLVMFLCLQDLIQTRQQIRVLARAYLSGLFVAVVITLLTSWSATSAIGRYSVGSINANYLGYSLAVGFAVIVLLWVTQENTFTSKMGLVTVGVAIIIGIELTGTRGAELGIVCLLVWLIICKLSKTPPMRTQLVVIGVVAVGIGTGFLDQALAAADFGSRGDGTLSGRLTLWAIARELWASSPWIGHGMWAMRASNPDGVDAHNVFLELGSALGIVGVVIFLALLRSILFVDTRGTEPRLRLLLIGSVLAVSAPAYLSGAWEPTPASWMILAIFSSISGLSVLHVGTPTHDHTSSRGGREHHIERR